MSTKIIKTVAALSITLGLSNLAVAGMCVNTDVEHNDTPVINGKKIEYAMAAITDTEYLTKYPNCVAANMRYLGMTHEKRAVPYLISLLNYKVQPESFGKPLNAEIYPAVAAFIELGVPAVPSLIEVLASTDSGSVQSNNAIESLMDMRIFRDDLNKPLIMMKKAEKAETDPVRAARLESAIQNARNKWCRFVVCTE